MVIEGSSRLPECFPLEGNAFKVGSADSWRLRELVKTGKPEPTLTFEICLCRVVGELDAALEVKKPN